MRHAYAALLIVVSLLLFVKFRKEDKIFYFLSGYFFFAGVWWTFGIISGMNLFSGMHLMIFRIITALALVVSCIVYVRERRKKKGGEEGTERLKKSK